MRYLRLVLFMALCFASVPAFFAGLGFELARQAFCVGGAAADRLIDYLAS